MSIVADRILAASPTTTRGQPTQLSSDPKGERIAYASGKSIFLRNIDNPAISKQYTAHTAQTSVARFSPSGFYVASGDASGIVRVWDCIGEGATKGEYPIISGRINDIAWDGDSQRIIAVGDGKERFGHCITADSGNSVGEISGHKSQCNSVSIRQQRPLRAATGSDDTSTVFLHGAPFKYNTTLRGHHSNFVYGVAFSPDGSSLVSVGADRKIWLYDGKTGEPKCQIGDGEHKGSIFGVSWARDSKKFVTASADQTVKVWDVEAGRVVQNWRFGEEGVVSIPNHQVGIVWPAGRSDGLIISLNLDGDFNYVCEGTQKPVRVVQGHQRNITAIGVSGDGNAKTETLWTGSFEGRVCSWDISAGIGEVVDGQTHTNQVTDFTAITDRIYSTGWDDTLRTIDASAKTFTGSAVKLGSQPRGISRSLKSKTVFAATLEGIEVYDEGGKKIGDFRTGFTPTSIAASETYVAVGGDDHGVRIYTVSGGSKLVLENELKASTAVVTALAFSPSGLYLAAGNSGGKITVYDTKTWNVVTDRWSSHTARVTSIAWNSEGTHAVSGGLDTNVFVWSMAKPGTRIKAPNAHKDGVNGVAWIENGKAVASVGADATVKTWKVDGLA